MSCFTFCLIAGTALYTNKKVEWDDWKVMVPDIVKTLIQEYYAKADKSLPNRDHYPRRENVSNLDT